MSASPILNIRLTGEESVALLDESISWTPVDKTEITLTMNSTTSPKTIDYSVVSNVRTILFYGNGSYTVSVTTKIGTDPTNTVDFDTQDFFLFSPTAAMAGTINSIIVSTTSSSNVEIQVRIYGED